MCRMDKVKVLLGDPEHMDISPRRPFGAEEVAFLEEISRQMSGEMLRGAFTGSLQEAGKAFGAFGFWCRRQNLRRMQEAYLDERARLGLGLLFHICPSNTPGLFLWSAAIGLLAGNSCLVRVSKKQAGEAWAACRILGKILEREAFAVLQNRLAVVAYPQEAREVTDRYSWECDGRIAWGGDEAIGEIRQSPLKPGAVEVNFPDRASAMLIDTETVLRMEESELGLQCQLFYQDTYGMDQNACSSPRLILWHGGTARELQLAQERWWSHVGECCAGYPISERQVYDKFHALCVAAMELDCGKAVWQDSKLCRIGLSGLGSDWAEWKGNSGSFLECQISDLSRLAEAAVPKLQTLVTLGIPQEEVLQAVLCGNCRGIQRIVRPGQAQEMELVWDGKNFMERLTRIISLA